MTNEVGNPSYLKTYRQVQNVIHYEVGNYL